MLCCDIPFRVSCRWLRLCVQRAQGKGMDWGQVICSTGGQAADDGNGCTNVLIGVARRNCAKWDVGTHAHLWSSIPPLRPSFKIWSTYTKFDQEAVVLPFLFFTNLLP